MIVADTNLVVYLLIDDDQTELARSVRTIDDDWTLPTAFSQPLLIALP